MNAEQQFPTYEQLKAGWLQMQAERDALRAALDSRNASYAAVLDSRDRLTDALFKIISGCDHAEDLKNFAREVIADEAKRHE